MENLITTIRITFVGIGDPFAGPIILYPRQYGRVKLFVPGSCADTKFTRKIMSQENNTRMRATIERLLWLIFMTIIYYTSFEYFRREKHDTVADTATQLPGSNSFELSSIYKSKDVRLSRCYFPEHNDNENYWKFICCCTMCTSAR